MPLNESNNTHPPRAPLTSGEKGGPASVKKYKYIEIPGKLKENLMKNLIAKNILQGKNDPEVKAVETLTKSFGKKKMKSWRYLNAVYLMRIDQERQKIGLEPIHNVIVK